MNTKTLLFKALICSCLGFASLASTPSAFAIGVELSCNDEALVVVHQFDSNFGHNHVIRIRNKGVIDYFNSSAGVFRNKTHLQLSQSTATMIQGFAKYDAVEARMYEKDSTGEPIYSKPTFVKVSRRGAGALVETYLPNIGAGPYWYFDSCQ